MKNGFPPNRLGDFIDLLTGFAFKSRNFSHNSHDIPLVKGENVGQGSILWDKSRFWPRDELKNFEKFRLKTDDVIIAMDRPWVTAGLKWAWITRTDPTSLLVQRVARLRGKQHLDQRFLRYIIGSPQFESYIIPITTGVNIPHISGKQISDYIFGLPPLPTQRKIAAILSAYDDLIQNNSQRIKILEEMAQAIYREWFVHFRFPGHEGVRMVESELGLIPEGWEVKRLDDLVSFQNSGTAVGEHLHNRIYLPIECLPRQSLAINEVKPWEEAQSSLHLFDEGDILFGAMRPYFHKVVVAPFKGVTRKTCFVFRTNNTQYHAFSALTLFQDSTISFANSHCKGATIPYAVWSDSLDGMPVAVPSIEFVKKFEDIVGHMISFIGKFYFINTNLHRTRDLLLPKLISGELDISELDIVIPEENA